MTNPYKKHAGFTARVNKAERIFTTCTPEDLPPRALDTCFEMYDGDAVAWELMHRCQTGNKKLLAALALHRRLEHFSILYHETNRKQPELF